MIEEYMDCQDEDKGMGTIGEREIWPLDRDQENMIDTSSIFNNDSFPPLPDFPCMSSSSSTSSTPAPTNPLRSSSSSSATSSSLATSWAVLKSDSEDLVAAENKSNDQVYPHPPTLSSSASMEPPPSDDCMDVMENLEYMDLIESDDIWDPSSIFESESSLQQFQQGPPELQYGQLQENNTHQEERSLDDLGTVFFEWLKSNKEHISAEDMRSIKIKRTTIESASKRLGNSKEGKKQLLKLILEWVEQYQLQKNNNTRVKEELAASSQLFPCQYQQQFQNPNPNFHDPNNCFSPTSWIPHPPPPPHYLADPPPPPAYPMVGYRGTSDPFCNQIVNGQSYPPPTEYHQMIECSGQMWSQPQFPLPPSQYNTFQDSGISHPLQALDGYGHHQYPYTQYYQGDGENMIVKLGASATKEARKKRMARQRRVLSHHRHQNQNQNQNHHHHHNHSHKHQSDQTQTNVAQVSNGNWVYWPSSSSSTATMMPPSDAPPPPQLVDPTPVHGTSDRRQGWKGEKNLKFLLQKVLKQSDVGNLGRIVLPKKEAETHLPELDARDGISIAMEDIGTSRVWNMKYRFWPNNKSRMYLLENTGDFVRANGLQEGDFIVLYSDIKCGKYLIRGVKVRQPGQKSEGKRSVKGPRNPRLTTPKAQKVQESRD